ncbi:MAG TPA: DUF2244 domain-containing protein [Azospirillaceae bacterium]|nr:DUF2244 domain-containing protein [Azospirillaceae bacterium]
MDTRPTQESAPSAEAPAGTTAGRRVFFSAVLHPHRSLSPRGFRILMGCVAGVSLGAGALFYLSGAWPIVGFFGIDVAVIYLAFRASYRSGRLYETVELTEEALTVERVEPERPVRRWRFAPYWLRVTMDDPPRHDSQVVLSSHGRSIAVGTFLSPEERLDFARALRGALDRARGAAPAAGGMA